MLVEGAIFKRQVGNIATILPTYQIETPLTPLILFSVTEMTGMNGSDNIFHLT